MPSIGVDSELREIHQRMRHWLESLACDRLRSCLGGRCTWTPSADIHETKEGYRIFVELAGVDPSTINVVVEGCTLNVSGVRSRPSVEGITRVQQLEMSSGPFQRSFQLPSPLDAEGACCSSRNGVLEIVLPKRSAQQPVRVSLRLQ